MSELSYFSHQILNKRCGMFYKMTKWWLLRSSQFSLKSELNPKTKSSLPQNAATTPSEARSPYRSLRFSVSLRSLSLLFSSLSHRRSRHRVFSPFSRHRPLRHALFSHSIRFSSSGSPLPLPPFTTHLSNYAFSRWSFYLCSWSLEISAGGLVSALLGVKESEARWIGWAGVNVPDEIGQKALTKALAEKILR